MWGYAMKSARTGPCNGNLHDTPAYSDDAVDAIHGIESHRNRLPYQHPTIRMIDRDDRATLSSSRVEVR